MTYRPRLQNVYFYLLNDNPEELAVVLNVRVPMAHSMCDLAHYRYDALHEAGHLTPDDLKEIFLSRLKHGKLELTDQEQRARIQQLADEFDELLP